MDQQLRQTPPARVTQVSLLLVPCCSTSVSIFLSLAGQRAPPVEDEDDNSRQQRGNDQAGDDEDVPQAHGGILGREGNTD